MNLEQYLLLKKCPHCKIDSPSLKSMHYFQTHASDEPISRFWRIYSCQRCGGVTSAYSLSQKGEVDNYYPSTESIDEAIPFKAKSFLEQAINSIHAPSGAIMLCASSVDAMLKDKGYNQGNLYSRINSAVSDHLITDNMATWAHEVRLDANDERHAAENANLPNTLEAQKAIDFTSALGEYLFVLPSKIQRGIQNATGNSENQN